MTHEALLALVLSYSPKASPKRRARLAEYIKGALINEALNYEWGAGRVDLDEDDCAGCNEPRVYCIC